MPSALRFRFRPLLVPLAALGLLAGCGDRVVAEPVSLADLAARPLSFTLTDVDSLEERESAIGAYRFTLLLAAGSGPCVRLEGNVTASLDGEAMKLERGGVPDTGAGGRDVCERPRVTFDFDPEEWPDGRDEAAQDLGVTLQDGTHTVRLVLAQAKAKRRFERVGSSSSTLRRGQTHAYRWLPDSDVLSGPVQVRLIHVATGISSPLEVGQEGSTARFPVPADTIEGDYLLRLQGTAAGRVRTCEGVASCEGLLIHSEEFKVTVVP